MLPEPVIDAMKPQCMKAGITQEHLQVGPRSGIAFEDRREILANRLSQTDHLGGLWPRLGRTLLIDVGDARDHLRIGGTLRTVKTYPVKL